MNKNLYRPPRFLSFLLSLFAIDSEHAQILGDFEEEYSFLVQKHGKIRALKWYMVQIAISVMPFISTTIKGNFAMLKSYIKVASRAIRKNIVHSTINIAGLSIGMASCILMLFWVQDELSYDNFHENIDRLYRVEMTVNKDGSKRYIDRKTPYPLAQALIEEFPEIENASKFQKKGSKTFKYNDKIFSEGSLAFVDPQFFDIFTFIFVQGDPLTALRDLQSIILTQSLAEKYFGTEQAVGKTITIDNNIEVTVTAVIEDIPQNTHFRGIQSTNCFVPYELREQFGPGMYGWNEFHLLTYVILRQGSNYRELNDKLTGYLGRKHEMALRHNYDIILHPVKNMHLYGVNSESTGMTLVYINTTLAALILLIACINYMNLASAFSLKRSREVGIRKVVGTTRSGLIFQFLSESVLLSLIALILSLIIVKTALPFFNAITGKPIEFGLTQLLFYLPSLFILAVATGILSGSYPAFFLSSMQPVNVLKGSPSIRGSRLLNRKILVVAQFAVSTVFIIGTLVVFKQYDFFLNRDVGFDEENIIYFNKQTIENARFEAFKNEALQNPDIDIFGAAGVIPARWTNFAFRDVDWQGKNPDESPVFQGIYVGYDYFKTLNIEILNGNTFTREKNNTNNVIINEIAAQIIGIKDPVGETIEFDDKQWTILGVVDDFPVFSLQHDMFPVLAVFDQEKSTRTFVKTSSGGTVLTGTIDYLETLWKEHFPEFPFVYYILEDLNTDLYSSEDRMRKIFSYFSFFSIFICCLGMYGLMSFLLQQRLKEISIRKILGARSLSLILNLSKESMKSILIANIIAIPIAWFIMNKWLQEFTFRISLESSVFIAGILFSAALGFLPIIPHIIKALRSNPVDSLRYE